MRTRKFAAAGVGAALAMAGLEAAAPAAAAAPLPGVVLNYGMTPAVVKVKPTTFRPYKDMYFSHLRWTKVTSTVGYATGTRHINTCEPSCADANYTTDRVALKFTRVRRTPEKVRVFSRVDVTVVETFDLPTAGYWD